MKHRITCKKHDNTIGFQIQGKPWWSPFWLDLWYDEEKEKYVLVYPYFYESLSDAEIALKNTKPKIHYNFLWHIW